MSLETSLSARVGCSAAGVVTVLGAPSTMGGLCLGRRGLIQQRESSFARFYFSRIGGIVYLSSIGNIIFIVSHLKTAFVVK